MALPKNEELIISGSIFKIEKSIISAAHLEFSQRLMEKGKSVAWNMAFLFVFEMLLIYFCWM